MKGGTAALIGLAAAAVGLSLLNASWLAPEPKGELMLIAHRGVAQTYASGDGCAASRMRPAGHKFIENTIPSVRRAFRFGTEAVALDVQIGKDGRAVLFADPSLDCRTDGKGPIGDHSLAELKRLDVGHGYTADGGKSFPLRGLGIGLMPTVEEMLREFPDERLIFKLAGTEPRDADLLAAAFARAVVAIGERFAFHGDERVIARMRVHAPKAWMWSDAGAARCGSDYLHWGWTGFVPGSCRGGTIAVPVDRQWLVWGWPNRFQDRMAGANASTIVVGAAGAAGIERPEQLGEVPRDFRGYLWVDNMHDIGRALAR